MTVKITFKVEITEKELAAALLPNGGKITEVTVEETPTRRRRSAATTQTGSTSAKKAAAKKEKKA